MNEQLETSEQITAEQLSSAMDSLLSRIGRQKRDGSIQAEYINPGSEADDNVAIESRPFGRIRRDPSEEGEGKVRYTVESIIPHNGGSADTLEFRNGTVFTRHKYWEQTGEHNQEEKEVEEELSPQEVAKIYGEITDPTLEDRFDAIDAFYKTKHESRGKTGRFIARIRKADRPRYF